jgi:hypothetical protein
MMRFIPLAFALPTAPASAGPTLTCEMPGNIATVGTTAATPSLRRITFTGATVAEDVDDAGA